MCRFINALKSALVTSVFLFVAAKSACAFEPELGAVPAPLDKHLEYVDGTSLDLQALRGKPTVLYFGADWCEPCVSRGRPATIAVMKKYAPMGLQVVFVSMDDNNIREKKLAEQKTTGLRIAMARLDRCAPGACMNGLRDLGKFGRIYYFPTAIVLDENGVVRSKLDRGMGVQGGLDEAATSVMKSAGLLKER